MMMLAAESEIRALPRVAIGATYEGGDPVLLEHMLPFVDYLEITPETLATVDSSGRITISQDMLRELKELAKHVKIIVHGVGLSIGSHDGWSPNYFHLLDQLLEHVDVAWHSEHLGYTKVDGEHLGIMLALPKTQMGLDMVCERVCEIQRRYPMPFALENIVHVLPDAPGDYSDAEFLNALAERTGCGILLDVYNLECDAHNQGFDIPSFLGALRLENVREIHVACGVEHNGFLLDVHSKLTRPSTIALAQDVVARAGGNPRVLVYEFMPEAVPGLGYAAIGEELRMLRGLFDG